MIRTVNIPVIIRAFVIIPLWMLVFTVSGQVSRTIYFQENLPSSNVLNPAFKPPAKFYINLPIISTLYIGFESPFSFNQLTSEYPSGDSLFIDRASVMDVLDKRNYFSFELYNEIGRAGFGFGRHYVHASIAKVFSTKFAFDKDLIGMVLFGNGSEDYIGKRLNFDKTALNMTSYHEFALAYSIQVSRKFTLGTRIKYLNGDFNVWTERAGISMYTDDQPNYAISASSDILIHTSSDISDFDNLIDQVEGYRWFDLSGNHGYGFDVGVEFEPSEQFRLSLSVTDIGWLRWKENVKNFTSANPDEEYLFTGFDIDDFINEGAFTDSIDFTDTLKNHFQLVEDNQPYTSHLTKKVYLGGIWKLNRNNELGLMIRTDIVEKRVQPSFTINYIKRVAHFMNISGSYSMLNRNLTNVGLGLTFKLGPVQLYGITDIFLGVMQPANTPNYNFQVGMNFLFGKPKDVYRGIPTEATDGVAE